MIGMGKQTVLTRSHKGTEGKREEFLTTKNAESAVGKEKK